jgi:DNA-binding Xre family transcriptional regulator
LKKLHEFPHGDVVPRLKDLLVVAHTTWGIPISKRMVARAARLNIKTINDLFNQETTLFDLHTLWKLCWYFQCGIGDLLQWIPPAGPAYPLRLGGTVQVGSITLPRTLPSEPHLIRNVILTKLEGVKIAEVAAATGLVANTVATLLNQNDPPTRIARPTLAAVCDYLSQREGRAIEIGELLVYDSPADSREDRK